MALEKKHSTALALLHLVDSITSSIDQKKFTVGICILSKALETVNHKNIARKIAALIAVSVV